MLTLFTLLFFLFVTPSWAAITTNGSIAFDSCGVSACTSYVTGNVNSINAWGLSAISIDTVSADDTAATLTDNAGSTWTRVGSTFNSNRKAELWISTNLLSANVTITISLSNSRFSSAVTEFYTGAVLSGNSNTANGIGTSATIDVTTQDANNWVVAGCAAGDSLSASVGNFRHGADSNGAAWSGLGDNTSVSPGSVTNTMTVATSDNWACVAVELRSTSGATTKKVQTIIVE